jgi:ATP-dependent protease Clp ATPase subunit
VREQQVEIVRGTVFIVTGERPRGCARSFVARHLARPGEVVKLSVGDAAHLVERGFVKLAGETEG